jgi:hypothetical protein
MPEETDPFCGRLCSFSPNLFLQAVVRFAPNQRFSHYIGIFMISW